jgi:hypothetical protein
MVDTPALARTQHATMRTSAALTVHRCTAAWRTSGCSASTASVSPSSMRILRSLA